IVMAETELFSLHLPELIARPGAFGQDFRARSLAACLFTAEDYVRASRERRIMIEEMQPLYRRFDLLVTANGSPAPRLDAHASLSFWQRPNFTSPFNCTGGPALALLCGFSKDELPLSLQIAGRPHEDALVLRVGHAYEMATGFFKREPDVKPGAAPAALDPKPWRPNTSQVEPAVRNVRGECSHTGRPATGTGANGGAGRGGPMGDRHGKAPAPRPSPLGRGFVNLRS